MNYHKVGTWVSGPQGKKQNSAKWPLSACPALLFPTFSPRHYSNF